MVLSILESGPYVTLEENAYFQKNVSMFLISACLRQHEIRPNTVQRLSDQVHINSVWFVCPQREINCINIL